METVAIDDKGIERTNETSNHFRPYSCDDTSRNIAQGEWTLDDTKKQKKKGKLSQRFPFLPLAWHVKSSEPMASTHKESRYSTTHALSLSRERGKERIPYTCPNHAGQQHMPYPQRSQTSRLGPRFPLLGGGREEAEGPMHISFLTHRRPRRVHVPSLCDDDGPEKTGCGIISKTLWRSKKNALARPGQGQANGEAEITVGSVCVHGVHRAHTHTHGNAVVVVGYAAAAGWIIIIVVVTS